MPEAAPDRRHVLKCLASLPALGALEALPASAPARPERTITVETLRAAQQLLGISFEEKELEQILPRLQRQPEGLEALRAHALGGADTPAEVFRPAGTLSLAPGGAVRALPEGIPDRPADARDLAYLPVHALSRLLRARRVTSRELTRVCLDRLAAADTRLLCVITPTPERAMEEAARADAEIAAGRWRGPLHGVPYGLKDLFSVRGYRTTFGARPFQDQVLDEDAAVYERLNAAGAVLCAKLTLGALAMGDVWFGGRTRNPWNPDQGSSGSSAGSASAVAAGLLPFALGTETLGSIVSPASRCGVSGLRPTFGRVSRHGAMALCWSLDKVGPLARCVRDLALVFDAIRGADPRDPSTVPAPFAFDPGAGGHEPLRIGYEPGAFSGNQVTADRAVLDVLRARGAELVPVQRPGLDARLLMPILDVEAAASFDAITRDGRVRTLVRQDDGSWPASFRRTRFYPAVEFVQASRLRRRLVGEWEEMLAGVDAMVAPSLRGNVLVPTNFTGHPTVVVPHGLGVSGARPSSISFVGRLFGEGRALEAAALYQDATGWHLQRPAAF